MGPDQLVSLVQLGLPDRHQNLEGRFCACGVEFEFPFALFIEVICI